MAMDTVGLACVRESNGGEVERPRVSGGQARRANPEQRCIESERSRLQYNMS